MRIDSDRPERRNASRLTLSGQSRRVFAGKRVVLSGSGCFTSETGHQAAGCITIHGLRNHQRDSERFSGVKTWDFMAQAGKSRTARLRGARNETLW